MKVAQNNERIFVKRIDELEDLLKTKDAKIQQTEKVNKELISQVEIINLFEKEKISFS